MNLKTILTATVAAATLTAGAATAEQVKIGIAAEAYPRLILQASGSAGKLKSSMPFVLLPNWTV